MDMFNKDLSADLLAGCEPPCLSLYQTTHRRHPENQQDPIRFRNLVKGLEESLLQKYAKAEAHDLLKPFLALADDREFWSHTQDGLAVLGGKGIFRVYKLQQPVAELVVVADSFHVKPLMRILQSAERYHVLGVSRKEVRLFEGTRDVLDEIDLDPAVSQAISQTLGSGPAESHESNAPQDSGSHLPPHHGHGGKEGGDDIDAERFFRAADRAILEHYSRPSGLPLILATLPENRQQFHHVSHSPFLMEHGIDVYPGTVPMDDLRHRAWTIFESHLQAQLAAQLEEFGTAQSNNLGNDQLADVAMAVVGGRVATLLVDGDREVPGRIDAMTGAITFGDMANPEIDDVLDDLGAMARKMGGKVVIVPSEQMPTQSGVAAIYRY